MSPELIGILTVGVALAALILNGQRATNERLTRLEERLTRLENDVANLRERMARLEGVLTVFTGQQSPGSAPTPAAIESPTV